MKVFSVHHEYLLTQNSLSDLVWKKERVKLLKYPGTSSSSFHRWNENFYGIFKMFTLLDMRMHSPRHLLHLLHIMQEQYQLEKRNHVFSAVIFLFSFRSIHYRGTSFMLTKGLSARWWRIGGIERYKATYIFGIEEILFSYFI